MVWNYVQNSNRDALYRDPKEKQRDWNTRQYLRLTKILHTSSCDQECNLSSISMGFLQYDFWWSKLIRGGGLYKGRGSKSKGTRKHKKVWQISYRCYESRMEKAQLWSSRSLTHRRCQVKILSGGTRNFRAWMAGCFAIAELYGFGQRGTERGRKELGFSGEREIGEIEGEGTEKLGFGFLVYIFWFFFLLWTLS